MKKVILFLTIILFLNIASAGYTCSSGNLTNQGKVVYNDEVKNVNGIDVAVIMSSWGGVAEMILDSKKITLTNQTSSIESELLSETYGVSLVNITGDDIWIDVEGNTKQIELKKLTSAGGLQLYALDVSGTYPGANANLELIIGSKYLFIYAQNPSSIETIADTKYGIEVPSSSNAEAYINITICENATITYVNDSISENTSTTNESTTQTQNESLNESIDSSTTTQQNLESQNQNSSLQNSSSIIKNNFPMIVTMIIVIIILVLGVIFYFNYRNYKANNQNNNQQTNQT